MKLVITEQALEWFQNEMALKSGDGVRFYGKTYGTTNVHQGFSVALSRDAEPLDPIVLVRQAGIMFYINERDEWLFHDYDLTVDVQNTEDGPVYKFT
ncbi:iron-sulfur cluster biosynthesis protein [Periweissella cryptocerci]|uniref:Iron-sulfur cluster biosynthesis protein n=1 Tax=Periweissella cryptocerci TaxID=2506420 RepID=A0A4P6YWF5_9LACO|nr:iron-sulfur cluster biosynthesis protein [Periweissella cryptocerci]QBO37229.1 iron-sulfur cluster biosynthesis protein [Periweissella cryptocerci]